MNGGAWARIFGEGRVDGLSAEWGALQAEVQAVRREQAAAADRILSALEALLALDLAAPHAPGALREAADEALEACEFQDLCGQRLDKIAYLAARLRRRTTVGQAGQAPTAAELREDERRQRLHLNGPALAGPEVAQAEIDVLFD